MLSKLMLGLFIGLSFFGCAAKKPVVQELDENIPTIEAKPYKLVSFGKSKMAIPRKAKILLKDGEFAGWAGCNAMGGTYEIDLKKQTVRFHQAPSTLMACPDMKLETKFRKYLQAVDGYDIRGKIMILKVDDTQVLDFMEQ